MCNTVYTRGKNIKNNYLIRGQIVTPWDDSQTEFRNYVESYRNLKSQRTQAQYLYRYEKKKNHHKLRKTD